MYVTGDLGTRRGPRHPVRSSPAVTPIPALTPLTAPPDARAHTELPVRPHSLSRARQHLAGAWGLAVLTGHRASDVPRAGLCGQTMRRCALAFARFPVRRPVGSPKGGSPRAAVLPPRTPGARSVFCSDIWPLPPAPDMESPSPLESPGGTGACLVVDGAVLKEPTPWLLS